MNPLERLLALQTLDSKIRVVERELHDIPARKEQESARLIAYRERVQAAQQKLKLREAELKQLELEVKSFQEKILKLRQQQLELKTNKEFKAIETEVETLKGNISGLEDRQITLMDAVDVERKAVDLEAKVLVEQEARLRADVEQLDARIKKLTTDVDALNAQRATVVTDVPSDFLTPYERVRKHKDPALVPLDHGVCGGCHMTLPPAIAHDTRRRTQLVTCGYCGRLLYCP